VGNKAISRTLRSFDASHDLVVHLGRHARSVMPF
jgi:hypothetical protein